MPTSDLPSDSEGSGGTDLGHTEQMPCASVFGADLNSANSASGPLPWDAVLIDSEGPTSVVGIAQQGRLVREERDGPRRVDLTWIDEAALALIDRAVERRRNLHLVYPAPAGELSVLVAAQLLLHRFAQGAPNLTVGIVTADTTRAARTWEGLRIATTGSREPVAEVFPCFRAGPEGESPLGHRKIPGIIVGRRVRDWRVDVLIEDHLAGPVIGDRGLPTIGLYADPLDPALGHLADAGEPLWGWDDAELAAWNSTLEVHTEGTVAFSVAHERLECMARGTEVVMEVAQHPEAEEVIARLREDLRLLREFAGSNPNRQLRKGMSVAWHHLSTLVSLPTTPTYFDHFAGVPPWAARATASFEHEMASWANSLTGDIGEVASVLASDMGDLRAALDRGNPLAEVAVTFASENPEGLLIVRNHTAARAFLGSMEEVGLPVRAQVTSMGRIHREGTWQRAVALGAPRRWDWHHLDSGIASDLHVAVLGAADGRSCQWGIGALRDARRRWAGLPVRSATWRAVVGTEPPPAPLAGAEQASRAIETVGGPEFVAEPDPFDAFGSLTELQPLRLDEEGTSEVVARQSEAGDWASEVSAVEVLTDKGRVLLEAGRPVEVREGSKIVDRIPEELDARSVLLVGRAAGRLGLLEALEERLRLRRPDLIAARLVLESYQNAVRRQFRESKMSPTELHRALVSEGCDKTVQAVRGWVGQTMAPRELADLKRLDTVLGLDLSETRLSEVFASVQRRRGFRRAAGRVLAEAARSSTVITDHDRVDSETGLSVADLRDAVVEATVISVTPCPEPVPVTELAHLEPL